MSKKEDIFYHHYDNGQSVEQAAIIAGYSAATAKQAGQRALRNRNKKNVLKQEVVIVCPETALKPSNNTDQLLVRLEAIAAFDLLDVADNNPDGDLEFKPLREWPLISRMALESVEQTIGTRPDGAKLVNTKYKFRDVLKAIEQLGKYHGMWMGIDQLVRGLKEYGIEIERDGDQFRIKQIGGS